MPFAIRHSLPDALADALVHSWGGAQAESLAIALAGTAPLDLRVNTLKTSRDALELPETGEMLAHENALRFPGGTQVSGWPAYEEGLVEVQDLGSQLACLAVGLKELHRLGSFAGAADRRMAVSSRAWGQTLPAG